MIMQIDSTTTSTTLYFGDCLVEMDNILDKSVDMVLCDLPYGTTQCKWDRVIDFDKLWQQYKRVVKDGGAIVLFAREPFTSLLVTSNILWYKHKLIWNKKQSGSAINAKYMPLQIDEDIIVFAKGKVNYYPVMRQGKMRRRGGYKKGNGIMGEMKEAFANMSDKYFPTNIIEFPNPRRNRFHVTEKPIEVLELLIEYYSKAGDVVLDNTMGSGSSGVAAKRIGRHFIGIENARKDFDTAVERIENARELPRPVTVVSINGKP